MHPRNGGGGAQPGASRVARSSLDDVQEKTRALKQLLPNCVSDGTFDVERLRVFLGGPNPSPEPSRYGLSWAGKESIAFSAPSSLALAPSLDDSVNFDSADNLFIEGDNLEVLKLLQRSYYEKVKMIYIDPPYNTGKDFLYSDRMRSNSGTYLEQSGQQKGGIRLTSNPETSGRYHSDWLSMMYPRLYLARNLLRPDGVIYVSIDDHEVHNLMLIMHDIFGEPNFVASLIWQKKNSPQNDEQAISTTHDYILAYAKDVTQYRCRLLPRTEKQLQKYSNPDNDPRGPWSPGDLSSKTKARGHSYEITSPTGRTFLPPKGRQWAPAKGRFDRMLAEGRIYFGKDGNSAPKTKQFLGEVRKGVIPTSMLLSREVGSTTDAIRELHSLGLHFDSPKPVSLIQHLINITTDDGAIMDFFAGSGTTAHAVLDLNRDDGGNRRFICVQLPELIEDTGKNSDAVGALKGLGRPLNIAEIAKERIRRVMGESGSPGFRVFKLARSNYRAWDEGVRGEDSLREQLRLFGSPLVDNYRDADVLYECLLKEGYSLSCRPVAMPEIGSNRVHKIAEGGRLTYLTLDRALRQETIDALSVRKNDVLICLDSAMTDTQKINLSRQCSLKAI